MENIRIRCPGYPSLSLPAEDASFVKIQELIVREWGVSVAEQRLVCAGQVIDESFEPRGGSIIYMSKPKGNASSPMPRKSPILGINEGLLSALAGSPQVLQEAFLQNPQIKRMAEKNPEFRQALNDPDTLAQMIKASVDPRAQAELQRGQDRMMSNLEMIPEGFQHLRRWHEQVDALSQDVTSPASMSPSLTSSAPSRDLNKEAMPNPWAPPSSRAKRKLGSLADDSEVMDQLEQLMSIMERNNDEKDGEDAFDWDRMRRTLQKQVPAQTSPIINPDNKRDLLTRFSAEMQMLQEMGFTNEDDNLRALLMTGGNVSSAIEQLVKRMQH